MEKSSLKLLWMTYFARSRKPVCSKPRLFIVCVFSQAKIQQQKKTINVVTNSEEIYSFNVF